MDNQTIQSSAYSPAGISSFFQIHGSLKNPKGAIGGGFTITKGVTTHVKIQKSEKRKIEIYINNVLRRNAETSRRVVDTLLMRYIEMPLKVSIRHDIEPPIGAGFGTSAAGALSLALALSKALKINLTLEEAAKIVHESEIINRTGLATVAALTVGGCVVTYKAGPPGICQILKIPVDPDIRLVAAYFNQKITREIFKIPNFDKIINRWGEKTLEIILKDPSVETMLKASKKFSLNAGLTTKKIRATIKVMECSGALAAAQNMIGEAAHAAVYKEDIDLIVENLRKEIMPKRIIISEIGGTPKILTPLFRTATIKY